MGPEHAPSPRLGLSGKLLVLTILFVMLGEVLIYVPSIANFRLNWLNDRIAVARIAAMTLEAAPRGMVPDALRHELLMEVGARWITVTRNGVPQMLADDGPPPPISATYDLRAGRGPG